MRIYRLRSILSGLLPAVLLAVSAPAAAQVVVVGSTIQERELPADGQYSGTVRLRNTTDESQEVRVYQTDYSFGVNGENHFPEPGTHPRSNATWISASPSHLVLGPREEETVSYTVTAPNAERGVLSGTYWSVLMVEGVQTAPSGVDLSSGQIGIRPRVRFAVQLASHIANSGRHGADLPEVRVTTTPAGGTILSIDVVNTGERAYRPEVELHLYTEEGDPVEVLGEQRGLLYPGSSLRQDFDVSAIPDGSYEALITVDTGGADLFGAQVRVAF